MERRSTFKSQFNVNLESIQLTIRPNGLGATGLETPDARPAISNRIFDLYVLSI